MKTLAHNLGHPQTFVVVARSLSFTLAAEELCLTQGAISHRIGSLETALGFKLFVRLTRKLALTEEGERLLRTLTQTFRVLDAELDAIHGNELSGELYIGIAPTFALSWLIPRLPDFRLRYPNLNLRLRVKASKLDFEHEPVDMAIYYSNGQHPGFYQQRLYDEWLTPVLSPAYAAQLASGTNEPRLEDASFIHCTEGIDMLSPTLEWASWLNARRLHLDLLRRHTIINHAEMALGTARFGMGVAMGRLSLARPWLDCGELVAPFQAVPSGLGYDLICPAGLENRPRYRAFADWIHSASMAERAFEP